MFLHVLDSQIGSLLRIVLYLGQVLVLLSARKTIMCITHEPTFSIVLRLIYALV